MKKIFIFCLFIFASGVAPSFASDCPKGLYLFLQEFTFSKRDVLKYQAQDTAIYNFFSTGLQALIRYEPLIAGYAIRFDGGELKDSGKDSLNRDYCEYIHASKYQTVLSHARFRLTRISPEALRLDVYTGRSLEPERVKVSMYLLSENLSLFSEIDDRVAQELSVIVGEKVIKEGQLLYQHNGSWIELGKIDGHSHGHSEN